MASEQKTFDFNRAQRQKFLRLLQLPKRRHLRAVLDKIEWHLMDNPFCFVFLQTLADEIGTSKSTVWRALGELQEMGYIGIQDDYRPGVGQTANKYWIVWSKVVNDSQSPTEEKEPSPIRPDRLMRRKQSAQPSVCAAETAATPPSQNRVPPSQNRVPPSQNEQPPSQNEQPPIQIEQAPLFKLNKPPIQIEQPFNHTINQTLKNHGHGESLGGKKRNGLNWGRKLTVQELKDPASVDRLYHFACQAGWVDGSEDARLKFHRLAIHCVREADNAPAMFSANLLVPRWHGTDDDTDVAARAIQRLDFPARSESPSPARRTVGGMFGMPSHAMAGVAEEFP